MALGLGAGYYFFGLFTPYNYFTARYDLVNGKVRLLTYGLQLTDDNQAAEVAREFGFEQQAVAGCEVTEVLMNGVAQYNAVVEDYLAGKHGQDWREKFDHQLSEQRKKQRDEHGRLILHDRKPDPPGSRP